MINQNEFTCKSEVFILGNICKSTGLMWTEFHRDIVPAFILKGMLAK